MRLPSGRRILAGHDEHAVHLSDTENLRRTGNQEIAFTQTCALQQVRTNRRIVQRHLLILQLCPDGRVLRLKDVHLLVAAP